jgi:hypothetical protein
VGAVTASSAASALLVAIPLVQSAVAREHPVNQTATAAGTDNGHDQGRKDRSFHSVYPFPLGRGNADSVLAISTCKTVDFRKTGKAGTSRSLQPGCRHSIRLLN